MKTKTLIVCVVVAFSISLIFVMVGCSGKSGEGDLIKVETPAQAGSQLEQAFEGSSGQVKESAGIASQAMRNGEYEKAIVSLNVVQQAPNITLQQGLAIHSSMVTLERDLINAMERGDPNAKKAYELLRRTKRN